ncbi:MAG: hypothetical protein ABIN89_17170 [Chitinophagaceae bacterium]
MHMRYDWQWDLSDLYILSTEEPGWLPDGFVNFQDGRRYKTESGFIFNVNDFRKVGYLVVYGKSCTTATLAERGTRIIKRVFVFISLARNFRLRLNAHGPLVSAGCHAEK